MNNQEIRSQAEFERRDRTQKKFLSEYTIRQCTVLQQKEGKQTETNDLLQDCSEEGNSNASKNKPMLESCVKTQTKKRYLLITVHF